MKWDALECPSRCDRLRARLSAAEAELTELRAAHVRDQLRIELLRGQLANIWEDCIAKARAKLERLGRDGWELQTLGRAQEALATLDNPWLGCEHVTMTAADWARETGLSPKCIRWRVKRGLVGDAVLAPPRGGEERGERGAGADDGGAGEAEDAGVEPRRAS